MYISQPWCVLYQELIKGDAAVIHDVFLSVWAQDGTTQFFFGSQTEIQSLGILDLNYFIRLHCLNPAFPTAHLTSAVMSFPTAVAISLDCVSKIMLPQSSRETLLCMVLPTVTEGYKMHGHVCAISDNIFIWWTWYTNIFVLYLLAVSVIADQEAKVLPCMSFSSFFFLLSVAIVVFTI